MLVHHADPVLDRGLRGAERDALAFDPDLALVRVVEPVEDVHERRLAGAVLAEERVHLAPAQVEVDVVVGEDAGEPLRDPPELERGRLFGHRLRILGGGRCPPPRNQLRRYCEGGLILPDAICFLITATFFVMKVRSAFDSLVLSLP